MQMWVIRMHQTTIKDSPIVEDTRRVRRRISERFYNVINSLIYYLQREEHKRKKKQNTKQSKKPLTESL